MEQTQIGSRLVFENAKGFAASQGYDVSKAVCTQSFIRAEVLASTTSQQYKLPLLTKDQNVSGFTTMKQAELQDIHVASSFGFFLALPSSAVAGNYKLVSWNSPQVFTTGAAQLGVAYNGYLNIVINNQNVLPALDLFRNYFVAQTQQAATGVPTTDQLDGNANGFTALEPNLLINGAANIVATLNFPAAPTTLDANTRFVGIFRTILLQNVTSVK